MLLQQPEAVGVNRPDEQTVEPVEGPTSHPTFDAISDPLLQFGRRPLGERERDDPLRRAALGQQVHDPLRDHFGLP